MPRDQIPLVRTKTRFNDTYALTSLINGELNCVNNFKALKKLTVLDLDGNDVNLVPQNVSDIGQVLTSDGDGGVYWDNVSDGSGMTYVGTTPATNYIYKALASDGKDAVQSSITDNGSTVTVVPGVTVVCETIQPTVIKTSEINTVALNGSMSIGNSLTGNIYLGRPTKTLAIYSDSLTANAINSTTIYAPNAYADNTWTDKVDTNTVYPLNIGTGNATTLTIGRISQTAVVNSDSLTANSFIKSGGTNIQYLMGDGSTLTQSATSGNSNFYLYQNKDGVTTPPPAGGDLGYNNAVQASATKVYISHLTQDVIDVEVFFKQINQLSDLYIQDKENSTNWIKYNITALPTLNIGSYLEVPVIMSSYGGTGNTTFGSNNRLLVAFFSNLTEVDQRLSTLETKTINQTAVAGTTSFAGAITTNSLYSLSSAPVNFFMDAYEINTNSPLNCAYIGSSDGITATGNITGASFMLPLGKSYEFLKADGTVDDNTYLTTTSASSTYLPIGIAGTVSGYALNPANRATTTITAATKSYYYTVLLNQATIISGFTVYLDSGSDIFRMGIFRGNNIAGQTITLCGQSTGAVLNDTTVFNRRAITAVAGQNLTFSAGEYMTVAFHSQGSTNVFLGSAVSGVVLVELTWQSNTNYASAGFPATLNSTAILSGFTARPCFELY